MKITKKRMVTILLSAIVIVGMAYLLSLFMGSTKAEVTAIQPPVDMAIVNPKGEEPKHEPQIVLFNDKIAEYDNLTMQVLKISLSGNDAIIDVFWELKDPRDWKINDAVLEIDSQSYSYAGFDLVEGLFHYSDGTACKIDMQQLSQEHECSKDWLKETPYRIDRLVFANVPRDLLSRSVQLIITGMEAFPSESEYCKVLNIEHIQKIMQADFPGLELECFQEDGFQGYQIKESSVFAGDEKVLASLTDHAVKALFGNMAGIWKFELTNN